MPLIKLWLLLNASKFFHSLTVFYFFFFQISIKLQIFSHLDVYALGRVAGVCHQWYSLANDAVLWELKLQRDAEHWQFIDHLSHPSLYKETITDLTPKELYVYII